MSSAAPARALVYRFGEQRRAHLQFAALKESPQHGFLLRFPFLCQQMQLPQDGCLQVLVGAKGPSFFGT